MPVEPELPLTEVRAAEALRLKNRFEALRLKQAEQAHDAEIRARTVAVTTGMEEALAQLSPAGKAFLKTAERSGMTAVDVLGLQREATRRGVSLNEVFLEGQGGY